MKDYFCIWSHQCCCAAVTGRQAAMLRLQRWRRRKWSWVKHSRQSGGWTDGWMDGDGRCEEMMRMNGEWFHGGVCAGSRLCMQLADTGGGGAPEQIQDFTGKLCLHH
ncbi:hypothetical protein INR49_020503 [Caranx melampygus]|nr:hypothetical protein INR49_020503 [Caranx melampygus]